jgi:formate-dependent nitrite reductase membrane component NrfD
MENESDKITKTFKQEVYDEIKSVIDLAFSKRMRNVLPIMFWTGISLATYTGLLVTILTLAMSKDSS